MGDILVEGEGRLDLTDDAGDMLPELARIACAALEAAAYANPLFGV